MKKSMIFSMMILCVILSGCGKVSPEEQSQQKMEACFTNTDLTNSAKIDFISYPVNKDTNEKERTWFSCSCTHKDIDTIFCRKNDYYESVYRMYRSVSELENKYRLSGCLIN